MSHGGVVREELRLDLNLRHAGYINSKIRLYRFNSKPQSLASVENQPQPLCPFPACGSPRDSSHAVSSRDDADCACSSSSRVAQRAAAADVAEAEDPEAEVARADPLQAVAPDDCGNRWPGTK